MDNLALGIDVGGTGIKGALVDTTTGQMQSDKLKYKTPQPATPDRVIEVIKLLLKDFNWENKPFCCGFPSVIKNDVCLTASNIHNDWIGLNLREYFFKHLGVEVNCINDADAAGLAEMKYGHGRGHTGTALFLTLGSGIGSALFLDSKLVPNTEFGQMPYKGVIAEHYSSNWVRKNNNLSWKEWGQRLAELIEVYHLLVSPSLIVLGGGVSKNFVEYEPYLRDIPVEIRPASLLNNAGIIGCTLLYKEGELNLHV